MLEHRPESAPPSTHLVRGTVTGIEKTPSLAWTIDNNRTIVFRTDGVHGDIGLAGRAALVVVGDPVVVSAVMDGTTRVANGLAA
jgi:hypothetical protein